MNTTPANFSYLIAEKIAGSAHPGSGELLGQTLASLREDGFGAVISLCEAPLEGAMLREFGFEYLHLPVVDSSVRDAVETAKIVLLLSPLIKDRSTEPRDLSLLLFLSDEKEQEFI
ncbi:MAG: hypothetical protein ACE10H_00280 [Candidatus Binatia bacterium]